MRPPADDLRGKFLGCLLGGAAGDALGAPVEYLKRSDIINIFGPGGIMMYAPPYGDASRVLGDKRTTLTTVLGLLRTWVREGLAGTQNYPDVMALTYLRWLQTQYERPRHCMDVDQGESGWLFRRKRMPYPHDIRLAMTSNGKEIKSDGLMRMPPVGMFAWRLRGNAYPEDTFRLGSQIAVITHGSPDGSLACGMLAVLIQLLIGGQSLPGALALAKQVLRQAAGHEQTLAALEQAEALAIKSWAPYEAIGQIGEGWGDEEALAISVYCALRSQEFSSTVAMAVNHDGSSGRTGAVVGHLLGAAQGIGGIPEQWIQGLDIKNALSELAANLYDFPDWFINDDWVNRFPEI